ncbi:hypothetical protein GUJ93_ZPchr0006g44204 [Zizania palustris]|uniref:Uncharacterized protein n=1 Tax=Zizania palustris TaxID=103762 RepID=A0A8J5VNZ0_ZIZPA|nr:hypothetical protein GUJ93_ZPchr0006g44204 [Zizania palustris]
MVDAAVGGWGPPAAARKWATTMAVADVAFICGPVEPARTSLRSAALSPLRPYPHRHRRPAPLSTEAASSASSPRAPPLLVRRTRGSPARKGRPRFRLGHKEKVKIFINVDRYTKHSTPFCYAPRNVRITPLATASFGDTADSSTSIFPRINVKDPYQRLGISREASEEEIRAARNFLINKYAGHKPSVNAIESAHDRIIMQSLLDRRKPKVNLKKKFRELSQSRPVKAIQGRFQTPSSKVIWQTAITYVLLGVLTLVFPTEEGPTLQVAISCAANIYFIYQRFKSGWRTFFYGFGSFFASWFLGTFLMVSVIPPILTGPRNLESNPVMVFLDLMSSELSCLLCRFQYSYCIIATLVRTWTSEEIVCTLILCNCTVLITDPFCHTVGSSKLSPSMIWPPSFDALTTL